MDSPHVQHKGEKDQVKYQKKEKQTSLAKRAALRRLRIRKQHNINTKKNKQKKANQSGQTSCLATAPHHHIRPA
jgi:hypothetical protein